MDRGAPTGSRCFLGNSFDAIRLPAHEGYLGSLPGELDRRGSADTAGGPGEHDDGHVGLLYVMRGENKRGAGAQAPS